MSVSYFTSNSGLLVPVDLKGTGTAEVVGAGTTGDTNPRVQLGADGSIRWGSGAAGVDTRLFRSSAGNLQFSTGTLSITAGSLDVSLAGQGLRVAEGANAKQGVATLVAGTVTVANTSVTANSRIMLTCQSLGTVVVPSALCVSALVAGTSFTILASQNTDTSVIAYEIFEPG
jgi:flagellar basal body rod protein FlgF